MMNEKPAIKRSLLWTYSLADNGFFIAMTLFTVYPLIFMTKCLGFPFPLAVKILTIAKVLDVGVNFFTGIIIEKLRMPWGKYRSWLLAGPIIAGIATVLFFSPLLTRVPPAVVLPLGVFLLFTWNASGNMVLVSYNALNSVLVKNPLERVYIYKFSKQTQAITDAIAGFFMMKIVFAVGMQQDINLAGMRVIGVIYSVIYIALPFAFFINLKDYKDKDGGYGKHPNIIDDIKILFTNSKVAALTLSGVFTYSAEVFFKAVVSYYFLFVLFSARVLDAFNWTTVLTAFAGATLAMPLARRTNKKTTYILGYVLMAAALVLAYALSAYPWLSLAAICLGIMGQNFSRAVFVPMYSDVSDWTRYRTGKNETSHVMVSYNLCFKLAGLIAASASGLLARAGYVTGVDPSPAVSQGIRVVATLGPAAFAAAGSVFMLLFFRFDEKQMPDIQAALRARENKQEET